MSFSILMSLLLPTAVVGVLVGFALVAVEWSRKRGDSQSTKGGVDRDVERGPAGTTLQRVPVLISGAVALIGLGALMINEIRRAPNFHPGVLVALSLLFVMGAPVIFWRSRWQRTMVGASTMAVSILAFITGFSIGVLFVPLAIAMILVCFSYLRRPTLVDSPV